MTTYPDASQYRGPLDPEECAKWDALADAGEEPVMEWEGVERDWYHIPCIRVYKFPEVFYMTADWHRRKHVIGYFRTLTGAKLCAEAILRERTRALHSKDTTPQETQANG
jgi:hypothetical protein